MAPQQTGPGHAWPLGATCHPSGVNFSVYARSATAVELLLFDEVGQAAPSRVLALDPRRHRTHPYWHIFVPGLAPGQLYAYRVTGPFDLPRGLRFDPDKVLLDPYGLCVAVPPDYSRLAASSFGDNSAVALKSVVADLDRYDWEGDAPLKRPFSQTVLYEMHVRGFTAHPSSGLAAEQRGTYRGLIEKIPYLVDLGITAVELLPIFQFDPQDCPQGLVNYWGYSPVSFFAPHQGYGSGSGALAVLDEFRDLVKALHRAGIEIILDVVYNHTAEGDEKGPTFCLRGFDNPTYYMLEENKAHYADYSGTGNTLNANNAVVRRLILDSLHHWVHEMHVDGFRFDLASILARDETGHPLERPPIIWDIDSDPELAGTKLIAEAWDAAGLYQVGSFVGDIWKEWNGVFRDDVRRFFKGDNETVRRFASRLLGSPDLYGQDEREPEQSINFVTCHDGFTLNDLVSFDRKHNEANGEANRDGSDSNFSWNCGVEGPSDDPAIEALRNRQVKNFILTTLLSLGTPMLLMGDEVRRTQRGNNNAYCHDDVTNWLDWRLLERHAELHRFVGKLIRYRLQRDLCEEDPNLSLNEILRRARIQWHGVRLNQPDWGPESHSLAVTARSWLGRFLLHTMFNAYWEPLAFELPPLRRRAWRRWVDTFRPAPDDICDWEAAPGVDGDTYTVAPRSVVLLFAPMPQRCEFTRA